MGYTSVLLRCPDALYAWYEAHLTPAQTVEQAMLHVLRTWQQMSPAGRENDVQHMAWLNKRLAELAPPPGPPSPLPEPARALPAVRKGTGAKYRKKNNRRRVRR